MQAQTFQATQSHAAFRNPLNASYREHSPLLLTEDQIADLAVIAAWNKIEVETGHCEPVQSMYTSPLSLLGGEVDTLSLIDTQIDLFQGRSISPSCKENLVEAWLEGQASYGEVVKAHQPKATFVKTLVRRAYATLYFVGGYAKVR